MSERTVTPLVSWSAGGLGCIAVSYDGTRVVSDTVDYHLRVWDLRTGALVLGPLKGHTSHVLAIAFSSDGNYIVSGSSDKTMRIWHARTGIPIGKPTRAHKFGVCSVATSRDGTRIVSGSEDMTIRIWDVRTGAPIGEILKGHTNRVRSVAFSPDSTRIVSGSWDCTLRIWDAHTGDLIGEPLKGHTSWVVSVAFSHDSALVVSGSYDRTIRIWDARTGAPIGKPIMGHTSSVYSVASLPDTTCIVSCSDDKTIRIWDVRAGTPIGEPLIGHTGGVLSVAVPPESRCIVSGSVDGTICVWEMPQNTSPPDTIAGRNTPAFDMVTSKMSAQEMFECLVKHGCKDLTASVDANGHSSSVIASGGFGDVRCVTLGNGAFAAVKTLRLRTLLKDDDKGLKRAVREVYIWSRLNHPNVQQLLGMVVFRGELGMVSPWMEQGNLQQYIAAHPDIERYPLCVQFASGVSYLHDIEMVHGDLKANNVLVSDDGILKINDFDHAILSDTTLRFSTTTRPGGGTLRWMAPELFEAEEEGENGDNKPQVARTKETDIYALGMTILEIYTGNVPFAEYRTDGGVCKAIIQKRIPRRPSELSGPEKQTRRLWQLLEKCWNYDPAARPNAPSVLKHLHKYST